MKAFDTVLHRRLMEEIKSYNIGGDILGWTGAFLRSRRQRAVVEGEISAWSKVISGVPQGSVLGPLLFIIYINDLPEVIRNSDSFLYGDTKLFEMIYEDGNCDQMQEDLKEAWEWSDKWLLKFHPNKCG